ncbi:MAG: hypothetical protein HY973_03565 [Candidatus Kerfeldbacteria bacterium]|nr:hypothetical protein [Candidatus Kerfeldbacteria bacterium]
MLLIWKQTAQLILEFLTDIVRFPWWWYGGGLKMVAGWSWRAWTNTRLRVSWRIFAKSLFKPMYQDYSWQGRIISLVMRGLLLLVKTGHVLLAGLLYAIPVLVWLAILPLSLLIIFSN